MQFSVSHPAGSGKWYPLYSTRPDKTQKLQCSRFYLFHNSMEIQMRGQTVSTRPYACLFHPAGERIYFRCATPFVHDWIMFDGDIAEDLQRYGLRPGEIYYPKKYQQISEIIRQLEDNSFFKDAYRPQTETALLHYLFICLSRQIALFGNTGSETMTIDSNLKKSFINTIRAHLLYHHLFSPIDLEYYCSIFNLDKNKLVKYYFQAYGCTPKQDMIRYRIKIAKFLLLTQNIKVAELSARLNYSNETYFIRQFKQQTGITPKAYKEKYMNSMNVSGFSLDVHDIIDNANTHEIFRLLETYHIEI